ncbi:tetratricopeptide repeat protein [Arhodomonas sp. SL1]|uniref:tetratricopeptide repeat protein n=1 Tax=Arhodomonas sp. SL1 TaxID=3425691 RepID=UPI003F880BA5
MTHSRASRHRAINPLPGWGQPDGSEPLRGLPPVARGEGRRILLVGEDGPIRAAVGDWITRRPEGTAVIAATLDVPLLEREPEVLLFRLGQAASALSPIPAGIPLQPGPMREALPNWLARAGATGGAIVVLEGVDRRGGDTDWLPGHVPPTVTVLATALPGGVADQLTASGWERIDVAGVSTSPRPPANRAEPLLRRLWASPDGVTDDELTGIDPGGDQRRTASAWLRRRPGRVALADDGMRRALASALELEGDRGSAWLTALASGTRDPIHAGGWLAVAEAWQELAARLAAPDTLDHWSSSAPVVAALWRRLPNPEAAWSSLAETLARARGREPTTREARRQLSAVSLLEALERPQEAAELRAAVTHWLARAGAPRSELAEALHRDGLAALDAGEPDPAMQRLEQALRLRRRIHGEHSAEALASEHAIAMVHETKGETEQAEQCYRRLLDGAAERHDPGDPRLIAYRANLAAVQRAANRLEPARDHLEGTLRTARQSLGEDHPATVSLQDALAGLLYAGGDPEGAEQHYRQVAASAERLFGPYHGATAAALHNLGTCLDSRGAYREAETCFRRALELRRSLHGPHHEDTASTLHNLAGVLDVTGRGREAQTLYREAIDAWERLVGADHPATATSVNNLADLLREQGNHREAEALYRRNLDTWEALFGPSHPNVLMTAAELGGLCADSDRPEEAEAWLQPALEELRARLGVTSGLYLDTALRLARLRAGRGRRDAALALLDEALGAAEGSTARLTARYQKLRRHRDAIAGDGQPAEGP